MNPSNLGAPLAQQIPQLPVWFVLLGGLIVTCIFWQFCPRPALLTLLALLLLGVATAVGPAANLWLVQERLAHHWTAVQLGFYIMEAGVIVNLVRAVGYGLLLAAVFSGRRPPRLPPAGTVSALSPVSPPTL